MKCIYFLLATLLSTGLAMATDPTDPYDNPDLEIATVEVRHAPEIGATIWEITVVGQAGKTTPIPAGQLHGAPVLGYVFPTSLAPADVGFGEAQGLVALALTSHPDFDDTPLWDENADRDFANDGIVWHPHWVILTEDDRVYGGLSVLEFDADDPDVMLPPTNPGMPMYMDSPGFQVITQGPVIRVVVPDYRMNHRTDFNYDGVAAFMQVNTEGVDADGSPQPLLGVHRVYAVASGDLSLPYQVK